MLPFRHIICASLLVGATASAESPSSKPSILDVEVLERARNGILPKMIDLHRDFYSSDKKFSIKTKEAKSSDAGREPEEKTVEVLNENVIPPFKSTNNKEFKRRTGLSNKKRSAEVKEAKSLATSMESKEKTEVIKGSMDQLESSSFSKAVSFPAIILSGLRSVISTPQIPNINLDAVHNFSWSTSIIKEDQVERNAILQVAISGFDYQTNLSYIYQPSPAFNIKAELNSGVHNSDLQMEHSGNPMFNNVGLNLDLRNLLVQTSYTFQGDPFDSTIDCSIRVPITASPFNNKNPDFSLGYTMSKAFSDSVTGIINFNYLYAGEMDIFDNGFNSIDLADPFGFNLGVSKSFDHRLLSSVQANLHASTNPFDGMEQLSIFTESYFIFVSGMNIKMTDELMLSTDISIGITKPSTPFGLTLSLGYSI